MESLNFLTTTICIAQLISKPSMAKKLQKFPERRQSNKNTLDILPSKTHQNIHEISDEENL